MDKRKHAKLDEYLQALYLMTARRRYVDIAQSARKESLSHEEYLLCVVEEEAQDRKNKRIERQLQSSRLPLEKTMDILDLNRFPIAVRHKIPMLLDGGFINHQENVLIFGNPGSGKTHLACALGQGLIRRDKRVYFTTCALFLQELLAAKRVLRLSHLIKKLNRYHVIIIDDIGYVQQDKEEMEVLFTLLAERYERGSVIIISNLPFSKWEKIFKDPMMTAAAIDRVVHHSIILELNIPSYRVAQAKKKKTEMEKVGV